ncbi:RNA-binding cell elongation regulator Jag/EloR [Pseudalkalibacillus caeni]|uniref:RNA-binding protein KhpB n=1 Tax=Exobacillus caeni TaxID=2574798 RepID=A0A5R9F2K1_9BACL|nr:RNA-binding cell elongation regulator Jag/EloR [Pseudalkalibacillus caeni]TLS35133.1 protein jag [Pseudalkalibacillus caeni]
MKSVTVTGKTVEEAIGAALTQLGTDREKVTVTVREEPKKGFFGLGGKPAIVEVSEKPDPFTESQKFLHEVTRKMGISIEIDASRKDHDLYFNLSGEKIAILIGKRGQTLNSLQYLTNLVANRFSDQYVRVVLDAENYRERRKETLQQLANRLAEKAIQTNRSVQLEPMPSLERKVIHMALKERKGISTHSDGKEPHRRVIIVPEKNN